MMTPIKLGILNENDTVRLRLTSALEKQLNILVVGSYRTAVAATHDIRQGEIYVVLVDFFMVRDDFFEFIIHVIQKKPGVRILVSLDEQQATTASLLLAMGAHGVICRGQPISQYLDALHMLACGKVYICQKISMVWPERKWVLAQTQGIKPSLPRALENPLLSRCEREVMRLYMHGLKPKAIADELGRSIKTISTQKKSALKKLGVESDAELFLSYSS